MKFSVYTFFMKFKCLYVSVICVPLCIFLAFQLSNCTDNRPVEVKDVKTKCKDNQQPNESNKLQDFRCFIGEGNINDQTDEQNEMFDEDDISNLNNNDVIIAVEENILLLQSGTSHITLGKVKNTPIRNPNVYHRSNIHNMGRNRKRRKPYRKNEHISTINTMNGLLLECSTPITLRLIGDLIMALLLVLAIHYFLHLFK